MFDTLKPPISFSYQSHLICHPSKKWEFDIGEHHPISSGEQKTTLKPPGMIFGYVWLYSQKITSFGLSHPHFCELNHLNSCFKNGNQPVMILNFLCHIFICFLVYIHILLRFSRFFPFLLIFFRLGTPKRRPTSRRSSGDSPAKADKLPPPLASPRAARASAACGVWVNGNDYVTGLVRENLQETMVFTIKFRAFL